LGILVMDIPILGILIQNNILIFVLGMLNLGISDMNISIKDIPILGILIQDN